MKIWKYEWALSNYLNNFGWIIFLVFLLILTSTIFQMYADTAQSKFWIIVNFIILGTWIMVFRNGEQMYRGFWISTQVIGEVTFTQLRETTQALHTQTLENQELKRKISRLSSKRK